MLRLRDWGRMLCLACGLAVMLPHLGAAEIATGAAPGLPAQSSETAAGYAAFFNGDLEAAATHFRAALENDRDHSALAGQAALAAGDCDYQKALELYCKAFAAARQSGWGEYYLERMRGPLNYCENPEPFVKAVQHAMKDEKYRPLLRDLAREQWGQWLMRTGHFAEAAEVFKPLQYLTQWALVGPLDNRDGVGFATASEPEGLIDFGKSVAGRGRRVEWFRPNVELPDGKIVLSELFEPRKHVLAYAVTFVKAESSGWAVLRSGFAGAFSAWVDGQPAGSAKVYNDFGADKLAEPVFLHAGWNQILVKSGIEEDGEWAFSARLCRLDGGALAGITCDSSPEALAAYLTAAKERGKVAAPPLTETSPDLGLLPALEQALKQGPENVLLLSAYAFMLDARKLGGKEEHLAAKQSLNAIALAPRCPFLRVELAAQSGDGNESRQAIEAAARTHPNLQLVQEYLTYLASRGELRTIAQDHALKIEKQFGAGRMVTSALVLADVLAANGREGSESRRAEALRLLHPFVEKHPYLPEGWHCLVSLENSQVLRRQALQKGLSCCGGDAGLRGDWVRELIAQGKENDAAAFLDAGQALRPMSVANLMEVAEQYRRSGQATHALALLDRARAWAPENVDLLYALGLAQRYCGRDGECVPIFREILRLKPNSPQVKDYLSQISGGNSTERQFFTPYEIALKDLPDPRAEAYPDDNSINLLSQQVVKVNPNGSSSRMVHIIAKLLRPAGIQDINRHSIYYDPAGQTVDILRAAVITPQGRELARAEISDRSTSAAMGVQTLIYDEHHLKQVYFKDLEPGSIVDLQYIIRDSGDNIYGDYFADTAFLTDGQPTLRNQYVLDFPKNLSVHTRTTVRQIQPERLASPDPQRELLKWEVDDTPGVARERGMPPVTDQLVQLQVSTMNSWQDVGQWYWNLAKDQLAVSDEMRKDILAMTRDCKTQTDKLRVVHDWVIRKIRYLGIEFGRNGYKPHKASESYKALYGDCKDTATLLASMLSVVGIDCDLVLLRTVSAGNSTADALAMPNVFNHCIAHVPNVDGREYWIDGTTDFFQLGEVPWSDEGAWVLVVDQRGGGKFMRIPVSPAQTNRVEQDYTVKVAKDGSASLSVRDVRHGQLAAGYRELAETPGRYERYMQDYAARRFDGAKVAANKDGSLRLKHSASTDQGPMWMESELELPALAVANGDRKALPTTFEPLMLSARFASETKRKQDLELWYGWTRKVRITYQLDPALTVAALPEKTEISEPFGKLVRNVTQTGQTLKIEEEFQLTHSRITTGEYELFRAFCNRVDSALDQKILLQAK